jgi:hypothetical protein
VSLLDATTVVFDENTPPGQDDGANVEHRRRNRALESSGWPKQGGKFHLPYVASLSAWAKASGWSRVLRCIVDVPQFSGQAPPGAGAK